MDVFFRPVLVKWYFLLSTVTKMHESIIFVNGLTGYGSGAYFAVANEDGIGLYKSKNK